MKPVVTLVLALCFLLPYTALSGACDSLVTLAWQAWNRNDQQTVERCFTSAVQADPHNARALLGLSYLYSMQQKTEKAWDVFSQALSALDDPYPYIFASWVTPKVRNHPHPETAGVIALAERLCKDPKAAPYIQAQAQEFLGEYYQSKGDFAASDRYFGAMKAVGTWTLIGPFENISASGFNKVFPPEQEYNPQAEYTGKDDVPARWFSPVAIRRDRWIDFTRYFAFNQSVYYGHTFVHSPSKRVCQIRIGTSGSVKGFLNDDLLIAYPDENNNDLDTYVIQTELQEGWNSLLIKCGYSEISACNFLVRITDTDGKPLEDLEYSTDLQKYPSHPKPRATVLQNFAEQFLQHQLELHPDWYEHYLLLADCYLRNDKAIEAELALRPAVEKLPSCAAFQCTLLEAYTRGEKNDELSSTLEHVSSLDPNIPTVLQYRIKQSIDNEDYDAAEKYIKDLERLEPGSREVYGQYLQLYGKKNDLEKIVAMGKKGYKEYPDEWGFVYLQAAIDIQTTKTVDGAVRLIQEYLTKKCDWTALQTLAQLYLQKGDIEKWKETCDRMFVLEPASPGYYYTMAKGASERRSYADAEQWTRKALELAPNASAYWTLLGSILRSQGRTAESIEAYERALVFQPATYEALEALRDLRGKPPVFSSIPEINADSLIAHAPAAADYPGQPAIMLLDDTRRVVFPHGASMMERERLVKVFNSAGIDDQKEYTIPFNSHSEGLLIEKAVVIKKDGSEIKADLQSNSVVFKSLEPGDAIHLKWRIKNYYAGKLAHHFWDTKNFSRYYPSRYVRYALLIPEGVHFDHKTLHMPDNPAVSTTPDGTLYQWTLANEPPVEFEKEMPNLDDAGKVLYISSIDRWDYLVDWYGDLAREKTRSTFEIKDQVNRLLAGKQNMSEEEKIQAIYAFITEEIRYSSVSFRQSGLIPQKARDVLATRIGDCKDVATLCIAMLHEAGIQAYHVLVNTRDEGMNTGVLPMLAFNHCIVAVESARGMQYLDLTAGNFPVGSVPKNDLDAFALLIKPGVTAPMNIPRGAFIPTTFVAHSDIVLASDNSAKATHDLSMTGISAASVRGYYRHVSEKDQLKRLGESMNNHYPGSRMVDLSFRCLDSLSQEMGMLFHAEVPAFALDAGKFRSIKNLWYLNFSPDDALAYEARTYPYQHESTEDTLREDVSLHLPTGMKPLDLPKDAHYSCSVADYASSYRFVKGTLLARRQFVYKKNVVMPEEYAAYKQFYNNVVRDNSRQILLKGK